MPQRCVNTLGRDTEGDASMQRSPYSELERQRELTEVILAASAERFVSGDRVVYFVQAGDSGPIKIGFCNKFAGVRARIGALQTGCPWPVVVRRIVRADAGRELEAELHTRFERHRLVGEWFLPVRELLEAAGCVVAAPKDATHLLLQNAYERGYKTGHLAGRAEAGLEHAADLRKLAESCTYDQEDVDYLAERQNEITALLEAA